MKHEWCVNLPGGEEAMNETRLPQRYRKAVVAGQCSSLYFAHCTFLIFPFLSQTLLEGPQDHAGSVIMQTSPLHDMLRMLIHEAIIEFCKDARHKIKADSFTPSSKNDVRGGKIILRRDTSMYRMTVWVKAHALQWRQERQQQKSRHR